jgi:hypothetical protein
LCQNYIVLMYIHQVSPAHCTSVQALLSYLDTEAERLVGRHTAITSAAAAAVAAATAYHSRHGSSSSDGAPGTPSGSSSRGKKGKPGSGLFSAMQNLLGGIGGKGGQQQQQQQNFGSRSDYGSLAAEGAAAADNSSSSSHSQQQQLLACQWAELSRICWCPIIAAPPDPALPWKDKQQQQQQQKVGFEAAGDSTGGAAAGSTKQQQQQQRLAAPCAARPKGDLWLVSAVMSVVDGDCRWVDGAVMWPQCSHMRSLCCAAAAGGWKW